MTEETDLGKVVDASRLSGAMPYIKDEFGRLEAILFNKVLSKLSTQSLTPDEALIAWMEFATYRNLSRKLGVRLAVGASAGERQAVTLTGNKE